MKKGAGGYGRSPETSGPGIWTGRKTMGKKTTFNTTVHETILKEAKKLAIDLGRSYNDLFEEALVDLLRKHGRDAVIPEDTVQKRLFMGR